MDPGGRRPTAASRRPRRTVQPLHPARSPGTGGLLSVPTVSIEGLDFVFVVATFVGIYVMYRLAMVVETGRIERSAVVGSLLAEVKRPLLAFTTVGGFSQLVEYPFGVLRRTRRTPRERERATKQERPRPHEDADRPRDDR